MTSCRQYMCASIGFIVLTNPLLLLNPTFHCVFAPITSPLPLFSDLDANVVRAIRTTSGIRRTVYVACDAAQALPNILEYVSCIDSLYNFKAPPPKILNIESMPQ